MEREKAEDECPPNGMMLISMSAHNESSCGSVERDTVFYHRQASLGRRTSISSKTCFPSHILRDLHS